MTPAERAFWLKANRRVSGLTPEMNAALLRAFAIIRESFSEAEIARIVASGNVENVMRVALSEAVLDRAFIPVRQRIRQTTERGFKFATADLPKKGKIDGEVAVAFDHLSPKVVDAVRELETDAINTLKGEVKEVTRAFVENGLRDGRPPRAVARQLRTVIGLAPNQEVAVQNFERLLRAGDREALTRALRDKRFDATLRRALGANGAGLTDAQIESMTTAYRRKFVAFNANVNAKTHTFDSYKLGQKLSWDQAKESGVIPPGHQVTKTWVHLAGQDHPRLHHQAMHGETVPADQPYSNGDTYAGEGDPWGCHCTDRYSVVRIS